MRFLGEFCTRSSFSQSLDPASSPLQVPSLTFIKTDGLSTHSASQAGTVTQESKSLGAILHHTLRTGARN